MSVLQKKMQATKAIPAALQALPKHFAEFYAQLGHALMDQLLQDTLCEPSHGAPKMSIYANFEACEAEIKGIVFAFGGLKLMNGQDEQGMCEVLVEMSSLLAQTIIDAKLGGNANPRNEEEKTVSLLNVLLVQPIAKLVGEHVQTMTGSSEQIGVCDRGLTLEQMNAVNFSKKHPWYKIDFPFSLQQSASASQKSKDEKPQKPKTGSKALAECSLNLYITPLVAHNVASHAQENQSSVNLDPDSPWPVHMRETMRTATRSLEIVIEDLKLSIADCTRLSLGQVIRLPGASHERLKVKTKGKDGKIILTTATLGVFKSNKAVKLNTDIIPEFFASP